MRHAMNITTTLSCCATCLPTELGGGALPEDFATDADLVDEIVQPSVGRGRLVAEFAVASPLAFLITLVAH